MRIGSSIQARKPAVFELAELRSDFAVEDFVQDRGQRLSIGIVFRIDITCRERIGCPIASCGEPRYRVLVEGVDDVKVECQGVVLIPTESVTMR